MKRLEGGYLGGRPTWSLASNPGVWAMEQVFARRAAGLWPVGAGSFDEFYEYVTLLLHMDGSNGATAFADSSLRNLAVTAVSSSITTSQSKFGGASGNFVRASGGRLNVATTKNEFVFGAGDFTIEAWVYLNSLPTSGYPGSFWICGWGPANANPGFDFYLTSTNIVVNITDFSSATATGVHGMSTGQWYHIAASRSGSAVKVFVNGQEKGSGSSTVDAVAPSYGNAIAISAAEPTGASTGGNFDGFIDELRITKGYCRYTSTFSVPTAAFENDGASIADPFYNYVSLLLPLNGSNNSTTFTDRSPGARTVTSSGDAKLSTADKRYGVSSAYFDGTGDFLTIADTNSGFTFGTGDFTYEWWFKSNATNNYAAMLTRPYSGAGGILISLNGATGDGAPEVYWREWSNSLFFKSSVTGLNDNKWHHFAFVRSGTTVYMFIDGVQAASKASVSTSVGSSSVIIGQDIEYAGRTYTGYIDDVRITKGVARYIANFIPPLPHADYGTLADPYLGASTLWMPMEGPNNSTGFFDRADRLPVTTYGNAKISNAQYKWGLTSAAFDGSGDGLTIPTADGFDFGTGDFTVELWINATAWSGVDRGIVTKGWTSGAYGAWLIYYDGPNNRIAFYSSSNNTSWDIASQVVMLPAPQANRWYHLAVTRSGTTFRTFVDGAQTNTFTSSASLVVNAAHNIGIGADRTGVTAGFAGYIDDLRIIKGHARYTTNFTPPTAPINADTSSDPYLSNVSLLLKMDGANNSTTFTDSSLTPKAVFANGDAKISTAESKFGGASGAFDGSGDYLTCTIAAFGANDFTIETWVRMRSYATYRMLYESRTSDGDGSGFVWGVNSIGQLFIYLAGFNLVSTDILPLNTWVHVALTRAGSAWRVFVNGTVQSASYSNAGNLTRTAVRIGMDWSSTGYGMDGYLDDYRITNGVARYTTNFLPPTIAHPVWSETDASFSSVSLLLNGNGANASTVIADRSSNGLTLAPNGNAQISTTQSRFGGSSLYFDGTGDWLYSSPNTPLDLPGDFTFECWVRWNTVTNGGIFHLYPGTPPSSTAGIALGYDGSNFAIYSGNTPYLRAYTVTGGVWYHIALVRASSSLTLYVNGVAQGASISDSVNYASNGLNIGLYYSTSFTFNGYIDDLRITKGVARYTAAFTPPVAPHPIPVIDPNFGAVSLLLHMNGANASTYFPDHSYNALAVTANGNAQISTAQSKFGGASALFDGTGDYLSCSSTSLLFGIDNFTIELWFNVSVAFSGTSQTFAGVWSASNYAWLLQATSTSVVCAFGNGSAYATQITGNWTAPSTATWNHLAVTRSGTNAYIFLNGTQLATTTVSTNISGTGAMSIGRNADGDQQYMTGYIDSLRITKGIARYTAAFTPPTAQFPNS